MNRSVTGQSVDELIGELRAIGGELGSSKPNAVFVLRVQTDALQIVNICGRRGVVAQAFADALEYLGENAEARQRYLRVEFFEVGTLP